HAHVQAMEDASQADEFLRVAVLRNVLDAQLARAQLDAHRHSSCDDDRNESSRAKEVDPEAVLDVVALELVARAGDIAQVDAAIGEDTIDVEADDTNLASERAVDH